MLAAVLDRGLSIELGAISNRAEGSLDDGMNPDREILGRVNSSGRSVDIVLHRQANGAWLFAAETNRAIPAIYSTYGTSAVERYLPNFLTKRISMDVAL